MSTIEAKYQEGLPATRLFDAEPAGWVLIDTTTGRPAHPGLYATQAEAETHIPAAIAAAHTAAERIAAALASQTTSTHAAITTPQVERIVALLGSRARTGNTAGFEGTEGLWTAAGNVDSAAVRRLTRSAASVLITSLTEQY